MSDVDEFESEENSFGDWVRITREKLGLDRKSIAQKAGISYAALYKIERGDIISPRQSTRDSIIAALDLPEADSAPEEPNAPLNEAGLGRLEDFDPYDPATIPEGGGVYVFYDISQRPVYVGRSINIKRRVATHNDRFWFKEPIVVSGSFVRIEDKNLRDQVERVLIAFLKSNAVINKKLVDRDGED